MGECHPVLPLPHHHATGAGGNIYDKDLVALWAILMEIWDKDPQKRPNMSAVAVKIMKLENRSACRSCVDQHCVHACNPIMYLPNTTCWLMLSARGRECIRITDDGPCADCSTQWDGVHWGGRWHGKHSESFFQVTSILLCRLRICLLAAVRAQIWQDMRWPPTISWTFAIAWR